MTPNRPYLIRALYDWIADNGCTPHVLVDAEAPGVRIPQASVKDGRIVLNIAMRAVADLELGNEHIRFNARFGGVPFPVLVPVDAVMAVYAQENGEGMIFPRNEPGEGVPTADVSTPGPDGSDEPPGGGSSGRSGGHLRVVK